MMMSQLAIVAIKASVAGLAGDGAAEVGDPLEEQVGVVRPAMSLSLASCALAISGSRSVRRISLRAGRGAGADASAPADRRRSTISNREVGIGDLGLVEDLGEHGRDDLRGRLRAVEGGRVEVELILAAAGEPARPRPAAVFGGIARRRLRRRGDRLAFADRSSRPGPGSGRTPRGSHS